MEKQVEYAWVVRNALGIELERFTGEDARLSAIRCADGWCRDRLPATARPERVS